jgi:hypothetical protein
MYTEHVSLKNTVVTNELQVFNKCNFFRFRLSMEFKVGSLADIISGIKSPDASTDSKLFRNVTEGKDVNIKFQAIHESKKDKSKRKSTGDVISQGHKKRQKTM